MNYQASAALLALRLVAGAAFVFHGWPKIQHASSWMDPEALVPGALQALAAFSEFAGGLAWIAGLLARPAALGILSTMTVAVYTHVSRGDPFVGQGGSWELAGVYWVIALVILLRGAGSWSIDAFLFKKKP